MKKKNICLFWLCCNTKDKLTTKARILWRNSMQLRLYPLLLFILLFIGDYKLNVDAGYDDVAKVATCGMVLRDGAVIVSATVGFEKIKFLLYAGFTNKS